MAREDPIRVDASARLAGLTCGFAMLLGGFGVLSGGCSHAERVPRPCLERAVFGDPNESPYVLPYPVGRVYKVVQAYCHPYGGHRDQLAYDFEMPIGDDVTAARSGVVRKVREDLPDTGGQSDPGQHNHVLILHEDGTVALYGHLEQNGVTVTEGQRVAQGQRIATSGNSGNTRGDPHLHFGVYQFWPATERFDVPVNFRNTNGHLDDRRGLVPGEAYPALPY